MLKTISDKLTDTLMYQFPELSIEQLDTVTYIFAENELTAWEQGLEAEQDNKKGMVEAFNERTARMMNSLCEDNERIFPEDLIDIKEEIYQYIEISLEEAEISNAIINNVIISGSRSRGLETQDSDLDVVVEISFTDGDYIKEDILFNILNDELAPLEIEEIPVDINPITAEKTGTLESYLKGADEYLRNKATDIKLARLKEALLDYLPEAVANDVFAAGLKTLYNIEIEAVEKEFERTI